MDYTLPHNRPIKLILILLTPPQLTRAVDANSLFYDVQECTAQEGIRPRVGFIF